MFFLRKKYFEHIHVICSCEKYFSGRFSRNVGSCGIHNHHEEPGFFIREYLIISGGKFSYSSIKCTVSSLCLKHYLNVPSYIREHNLNLFLFFYFHFINLYLKLLLSQSKFSGSRKFTLRYRWFGMKYDFFSGLYLCQFSVNYLCHIAIMSVLLCQRLLNW